VDVLVVAMVWDASVKVRLVVVVVLVAIMIVVAMAATASAVAIMIAITATAMVIAAVVASGSADQWAVAPATPDVALAVLAATTMVAHPSAAGNHPFLAWCK
jgi:hypothetical protein